MLQSKIGRNFLIVFFLINALLIGGFIYAVLKRPELLHMLPGKFGPALSPDLSGNMLALAILLFVNAAVFLFFGLTGTLHGLLAGLRISPRKLRWLLHERAGLANDISGVVAEAIQEEEKDEVWYLGLTRTLLLIGLLAFAASLPALCVAYIHAAPDGAAVFENAGKPVANGAVSQDTVLRFTADQLAGGLLLDVPEVFHLRATPTEANGANIGPGVLVVLYRALIGFGLLLWFIAGRRVSSLRDYAMEVAMSAADVVAMEPVLQDGHGHHDHDTHDHGQPDSHGHHDGEHHDDHGHHDHHDDHGNDDHGHDDHGHNDHGHDAHDHGHHDDHASGQEDHGHGHHEDAHAHHAPAEHADPHHSHHAHAEDSEAESQEHGAGGDDTSDDLPPGADHGHDKHADSHGHDHAAQEPHGHGDHHSHAAVAHSRETETVA